MLTCHHCAAVCRHVTGVVWKDGRMAMGTAAIGLPSEKINPSPGAILGNYPQGFSHIGVITSEVNMARWLRKEEQMR